MSLDQDDRSSLALGALAEVTEPASVGELVRVEELEEGVRNLVFACRLPGYRDWSWIVSTAQVEGADPTVLEVELLPGEGALLAPPWVPWAERLAEYRRTHPDEAVEVDELAEDDLDDDADLDETDLDEVDDDALELDVVDFEDDEDEVDEVGDGQDERDEP
ncbi:MAG: hypothetical protein QOE37_1688, partial [Microbacteriaceae bacterium]|nr:hypothetical protein [Microbacteriaceae bacterium]